MTSPLNDTLFRTLRTDVRKAGSLDGVFVEMAEPLPSDEDLKAMRERLVIAARASAVPSDDAEDLTQEALYRALKDDRPSKLPLASRAKRKLRDVRAEHFRSPKRALLAEAEPLAEQEALAREDAAYGMIELKDMVKSVGGEDVLAYARLRALKVPEREMAQRLDWTEQRVGAARKQFARKSPAMIDAVKKSSP